MKLTEQQLQDFDRDGYLFFPSLFSPQEMKVLLDQIPRSTRSSGRRSSARRIRMPCAPFSPVT